MATTEFDLHDMVADVPDVCLPRALVAGIGFEWQLDPCVPRTVVGDPGRLLQVLTNLLDNALKFTHQGDVTLAVSPGSADDQNASPGEAVNFTVTDTGIGIQDDQQHSVFDSFSQVDGSATRHHGGSGLGLAICKS